MAVSMAAMEPGELRVLELYSGIGGMHWALEESCIPCEVVGAADINNVANDIYRHNFRNTKIFQKVIESFTVNDLNKLSPDMITMSPPCQPFTRVGLQKDSSDQRTKSFFHVLDLLPKLSKLPSYILLENVRGFETSLTHQELLDTLKHCGYTIQEFLLTPNQFGVPNSRLRFYLLAKRPGLRFNFPTFPGVRDDIPECVEPYLIHRVKQAASSHNTSSQHTPPDQTSGTKPDQPTPNTTESKNEICTSLENTANPPQPSNHDGFALENAENKNQTPTHYIATVQNTENTQQPQNQDDLTPTPTKNPKLLEPAGSCEDSMVHLESRSEGSSEGVGGEPVVLRERYRSMCQPVSAYLEQGPEEYLQQFLLAEKWFKRFWCMDIILEDAKSCCCFTKAYGHRIEGAGSILQTVPGAKVDLNIYKEKRAADETTHDAVRALGLRFFSPREVANIMCFPQKFSFPENLSAVQCYRVLGNSLNVHVVSILMRLLYLGDEEV